MIGVKIGPYEIVAKLGEGGMGEVWRARDPHLGREVALKVLPQAFTADRDRLARFRREAKLLAQLNHPNIAQIHGLEMRDETPVLVMELVEGPTLAERLRSGPLPVEESLAVARQIAAALEEAHEKGIVHRDLKPQNSKASRDGQVKVLDFGLAKAMEPTTAEASASRLDDAPTLTFDGTREGVVVGTAAYMAPEQARGTAVDKRADNWSFGVVLYEMLTGETLFARGSVVDTLSAVIGEKVDLGRLPAAVPPRVGELVRRCLERDPRRRLRDIGEARLVLDSPAGAESSVDTAAAPQPSARRGLTLALGGAALVVGGLIGATLTRVVSRPESARPIRLHALTYSGADDEPAASPDGQLVAFTSRRDGVARIWIRQIAGGGEAPLTSGPDGLARFSPDGASLLFVRDVGTTQSVYRIGLVGGEPRRLIDNAIAADWSPDGRQIVFVRNTRGKRLAAEICTLDLGTGKESVRVNLGDRLVHSPRWSPDGRTIAFSSGTFSASDWTLQTVDLASGKVAAVAPGAPTSALGGIAWSGSGRSFFYVQSPGIMGDITGSGSTVLRCDVSSGERRTLFWNDGLSWLNSTLSGISQLDVLAPGRLLFGQRLRRQNLRELVPGAPAGSARLLAAGSSIDRQPVYSADGSRIFFSSNRGGNLDLWMLERATGALRQVTDDPAEDWDPSFTPDGQGIVWSSSRQTGHLEVWIAHADGSGARRVSSDGISAQNPIATPDGWIVYWSGNPAKMGLWKVRADGSRATLLARAMNPAISDVSPDGRYAYWLEQDRLNLRNILRFVEVGSGRVLPATVEVRYTLGATAVTWARARWTPDGRSILFIGEDERGLSGIYSQEFAPDRDTASTRRPIAGFSPEYVTESFGISPDGNLLTVSTGQETSAIMLAEDVPGAVPPVRKRG